MIIISIPIMLPYQIVDTKSLGEYFLYFIIS